MRAAYEPNTTDRSGPARINISILMVCGLLLAPLLTVSMFLVLMSRQNEIANDERTNQANGLLSYFADSKKINTTENSHWDQNYTAVVLYGDLDWWQANLGYTQYGNMRHEASAVVDTDGIVLAGGWLGEDRAWDPAALFGPVYRDLLAMLVADPHAEALGSFVGGPDGVGYFTIAEITPESADRVETRRFNLFYFRMDHDQMEHLRETSSWDDLTIAADASGSSNVPIRDARGRVAGHLVWDRPNPAFLAIGEMLPLLICATVFGVGTSLGLIAKVRESTRRLVRSRADAIDLANRDVLTELANRRRLRQELGAALAARSDGGGPFQLLVIDLDGFKAVNDALGHRVGDDVLIEVSRRLARLTEGRGLAARTGGDEFAILHFGSVCEAREFGHDLIMAISSPCAVPGQTVSVSASIGIANAEADVHSDELVRRADVAMFVAKDNKPGAVRLYLDAYDSDLRLQLELEREMRAGLPRGEFFVVYQPIYSIAAGRVTGVEALVRWNHPTRGLVSPLDFISAAECSRFVIELGAFVMREACRAFAAEPGLRISVNLSPVQMLDEQLVAKVSAILRETGIDPRRLELEITEGYLIAQEDRAADVVRRLRALGLQISLDDFGTGYASVGYLRKFALDKVKIDRSFVLPIVGDLQAREVARAIIALCRAFGVTITAEGVETMEQAGLLHAMGCDLLQGYLISKPVCAAEIAGLLDAFRLQPPLPGAA